MNKLSMKKELDNVENRISTFNNEISINMRKIAVEMAYMKEDKLYKVCGYKNIYKWAEDKYGYKKNFTKVLIAVGGNFIDRSNYESLLPHYERDYTVLQIGELLPYGSFNEIYELCESGEITPYMSPQAIRKIVKNKYDALMNRVFL